MKKMKRAALAMLPLQQFHWLDAVEATQLLQQIPRQQVKAAQKAEIPVIFPVTSLFPGGAEIQDMKQLKKRSRLFRQNTKV